MKKLIGLVVVLFLAWSGYWAVGSWAARKGIGTWFAQQRDAGLDAGYEAISVWGYPSRFDITLTQPRIRKDGSGWSAPFLQVFALSYNPFHLIAVWPNEQTVHTPGGDVAVASRDMRASAVFRPGLSFPLDHSSLVVGGLTVGTGATAWGADTFRFATRLTAGSDRTHEIGIEALTVALPQALRDRLDPEGRLPATFDRFHLDADLGFDRVIDKTALEAPPLLSTIDLRDATATWGKASVTVTGKLSANAQGYAEGNLDVTAQDWKSLVDLAVNAGVIQDKDRGMVEGALGMLAGKDGRLNAPLTLKAGQIVLGFIPLGPAPRLWP